MRDRLSALKRRWLRSVLAGAIISAPVAANAQGALRDTDVAVLRATAAAAVIDCEFTGCDAGDFNDDGRVVVADVVAALHLHQADPSRYERLLVEDDPSRSGVFDASLVFPDGGADGWMAYSGVDYHASDGALVRDVTTRIAISSDRGAAWRPQQTLAVPSAATITVTPAALCGQRQCDGRLISEVPFIVDDAGDPDPQRRFKLFAHRYFLYPPAAARGEDAQYQLGSINLMTAAASIGPWSADAPLLGWNLTPPEIRPPINVNQLGPVMQTCLALSEGDAQAIAGDLDVVFICPYLEAGSIRQRIVLLRSGDHAASFTFVATLLEEEDAAIVGAARFSAPSLVVVDGRVYLLVTPVVGGPTPYAGCVVVAIPDRQAGRAERDRAGRLLFRQLLPTTDGRFGGACAWHPGSTATGIVMSQLVTDIGVVDSFRLFATHVVP